jgi:hypothetical protein
MSSSLKEKNSIRRRKITNPDDLSLVQSFDVTGLPKNQTGSIRKNKVNEENKR